MGTPRKKDPRDATHVEGAVPLCSLLAPLQKAGVTDITVRLDKVFFNRTMMECLEAQGVSYLLKVPDHHWVRGALGPMRRSAKCLEITRHPKLAIWSGRGTLSGDRLLSLERPHTEEADDELFDPVRVTQRSHVLTELPGLHALTSWRMYNGGAEVEQQIEDLAQLGAGRTAVDDLGGHALLWQLARLAYQLLHVVRSTALQGSWRPTQPNRLRNWIFRMPARLPRHARKTDLQFLRSEPVRRLLLRALRAIAQLRAPLPLDAVA